LPETQAGRKAFAGIRCCLLLFAGWKPAGKTLRTFVV